MKNTKTWLIVGGSAAALSLGYAGWKNRRLFLVHDVTTGESSAYPTLRSRVYYSDSNAVLTAAEQAMRVLPRWRVVSIDPENEIIEAEVEKPIELFTDDITMYVTPLGKGQTRVTIRSRSRAGGGDLGRNVQHIRMLQNAMDARLQAESALT